MGDRVSTRDVLRIWGPLAFTWAMMTVEGPLLTGIIARLSDPKLNLAAFGVCLSLVLMCEAPILGLISGSIALVKDRDSYVAFHRFALVHSAMSGFALVLLSLEPFFSSVTLGLLELEPDVARLIRIGLWILAPTPFIVGMRRFYQGVLVGAGSSRIVAIGTGCRIALIAAIALALYAFSTLPGIFVAVTSLISGLVFEWLFALFASRGAVRQLLRTPPTVGAAVLTTRSMVAFYYPFALSTVVAIAAQPVISLFLARGRMPLESLAAYPVISALTLLFRSGAFAFQEAAVAALSRSWDNLAVCIRAARLIAFASSAGLSLIVLSPLAEWWFIRLNGIPPDLAAFSRVAAATLALTPALAIWIAFERGALVVLKRTGVITKSGVIELAVLTGAMAAMIVLPISGLNASSAALVLSSAFSALYLTVRRRRAKICTGPPSPFCGNTPA